MFTECVVEEPRSENRGANLTLGFENKTFFKNTNLAENIDKYKKNSASTPRNKCIIST